MLENKQRQQQQLDSGIEEDKDVDAPDEVEVAGKGMDIYISWFSYFFPLIFKTSKGSSGGDLSKSSNL